VEPEKYLYTPLLRVEIVLNKLSTSVGRDLNLEGACFDFGIIFLRSRFFNSKQFIGEVALNTAIV